MVMVRALTLYGALVAGHAAVARGTSDATFVSPVPGPAAHVTSCLPELIPAATAVGAEPAFKFIKRSDLDKNWKPACASPALASDFSTIVVTSGRIQSAASADELLKRIGRISSMKGVRYWSTSHKMWKTLIETAYPVTRAGKAREDFSLEEMRRGDSLYFRQKDNLAGEATYRLVVTTATADHIAFAIENSSKMKYLVVKLFDPGELRSEYYLDREGTGTWRLSSLVRTGAHASGLATKNDASAINRAIAFYRHFAGIQTDKEPPAAR